MTANLTLSLLGTRDRPKEVDSLCDRLPHGCFARVRLCRRSRSGRTKRSTFAAALATVRLRRPAPAALRSGQLAIRLAT